jgi:pSer/pThr/pTyr-binding forkhead associated (FHA) protein
MEYAMENTVAEDKGKKIVSSDIIRRGVLLAVSSNLFGRTAILTDRELLIGRDSSSGFSISDTQVSSRHCRVFVKDGIFMLEDLESTNGTYLNRKRIKHEMSLNYGDRIVLGDTIFRFFYEEEL